MGGATYVKKDKLDKQQIYVTKKELLSLLKKWALGLLIISVVGIFSYGVLFGLMLLI